MDRVEEFFKQNDLFRTDPNPPFDHWATKFNTPEYEAARNLAATDCKWLTETEMDGRRISVVELRHPLEIMVASPYHPIISTSRLELMERRPGQEAGPENAVVPDHVDILIASPLPDEIILTILKAIRIGHIIILGFC